MIGQTVSHYRITGEIGAGGMGVVYEAEDLTLRRTVALKFLPPELTRDADARKRFVQEARAASALDHHNICTIHEVGESDGHVFIVMARYQGETLKEHIARGPLPMDEALDIASQIAAGVGKAHATGIVHRDIKPGNIFITGDGVVKILDFGLARLAGETRLTKTGTTVGTVMYMSPEQATGGAVDACSDVWSIGAVLYEMLAGRAPFVGEADAAVVYQIINTEPPLLTERRRDVPASLEGVVEKALAKNPGKRYRTADDLHSALTQQKDLLSLGATGRRFPALKKFRRNRPAFFGSMIGIAVVLAVVATLVFYESGQAIDTIAVLPVENLTGDPAQEYLADGMTTQLIARLGQTAAFNKVVSWTSVKHYKEHRKPLPDIARELGVKAVVEGSMLRSGDTIQMTAQLIDARDENPLWSDSYERSFDNVLTLFNDITRAIVGEIRANLSPQAEAALASAPAVNQEAFRACLLGNVAASKYAVSEFRKSFGLFEKAIRIDPGYAPAYAGLAQAYANADLFYLPQDSTYDKIQFATTRALELDPRLPEAHVALGMFKSVNEWDWNAADAAFRRALELDPTCESALREYGSFLIHMGRHNEGMNYLERSVEVAPLSVFCNQNLGWGYFHCRQYEKSLAQFKATLELMDQFPDPIKEKQIHRQLMWCYTAMGRYEYAFAEMEWLGDWIESDDFDRFWLYEASGRRGEIDDVVDTVLARATEDINPWALSALGEVDRAVECLDSLYADHSSHMMFVNTPPEYDNLYSHPGYHDLLARLDFPVKAP